MVYSPKEDSFLLSQLVSEYLKNKDKNIKILDLGTGTGIQAETCRKLGFKNILCSDIDIEAVNLVKKKGFKTIKSDLFEKIKGKFDLILFNPPYLPEDKYDSGIDTTGGKKGDEVIIKFLKQVKKHLNKDGEIILLLSSLTPKTRIKAQLIKQKLTSKLIKKQKIFFETLELFLLRKSIGK